MENLQWPVMGLAGAADSGHREGHAGQGGNAQTVGMSACRHRYASKSSQSDHIYSTPRDKTTSPYRIANKRPRKDGVSLRDSGCQHCSQTFLGSRSSTPHSSNAAHVAWTPWQSAVHHRSLHCHSTRCQAPCMEGGNLGLTGAGTPRRPRH